MKKVFGLGLLAIVLASFTFMSCSKDDEKEETKFSLVGKTYAAFAYHISESNIGGFHMDGYRFTSDSECERMCRQNSPTGKFIGDIDKCTYKLDYPTIKIKRDETTDTGTFIDENAFRITYNNGDVMEYIKQ